MVSTLPSGGLLLWEWTEEDIQVSSKCHLRQCSAGTAYFSLHLGKCQFSLTPAPSPCLGPKRFSQIRIMSHSALVNVLEIQVGQELDMAQKSLHMTSLHTRSKSHRKPWNLLVLEDSETHLINSLFTQSVDFSWVDSVFQVLVLSPGDTVVNQRMESSHLHTV